MGETTSTMTDTKEDFIIGISLFTGKGLEEENEYLTMNIPSLIREQLLQFPFHYVDEKEMKAYREGMREEAVHEKQKAMNSIYLERDRLFLSGKISESRQQEFEDKINDLQNEIDSFRSIPDENIQVISRKGIKIYAHEENAGLLPEPQIGPEGIAGLFDLDAYISGTIEQIGNYFVIEIRIWSNIFKNEILVVKDAGSRDDLQEVLNRMVAATYDIVIGEEWAFVDIKVQPETGDIFIDENFVGTGSVEEEYIKPGTHVISATASGYKKEEKEVVIPPHETAVINLQLERREEKSILISSEPKNANVYFGSLWLGRTPVMLPLPEDTMHRIMITKKDYSPAFVHIGAENTGNIDVRLSPFAFDSSDYLEKKRDAFYWAAGFFVLSFPVPFFLYSITEDLASGLSIAIQNGNYEEMEKKYKASVFTYHAYLGTIVITASLLVNTLFRLAEYIQASEVY